MTPESVRLEQAGPHLLPRSSAHTPGKRGFDCSFLVGRGWRHGSGPHTRGGWGVLISRWEKCLEASFPAPRGGFLISFLPKPAEECYKTMWLETHVLPVSSLHSLTSFLTLPQKIVTGKKKKKKNSHRPSTFRRGLSLLQLPTAWRSLSCTVATAPKHLHLVQRWVPGERKERPTFCTKVQCFTLLGLAQWVAQGQGLRNDCWMDGKTPGHIQGGRGNRCVRCASLVSMGMTWMGKAKW